jgi:hypothetical protein
MVSVKDNLNYYRQILNMLAYNVFAAQTQKTQNIFMTVWCICWANPKYTFFAILSSYKY